MSFRKPIMKAADFQDGQIAVGAGAAGYVVEELDGFIAPRAHLSSQNDLTTLVTQTDRHLLAVQIDGKGTI